MIANLTVNTKQIRLVLGDYRFIKFVDCPVSHTDPNFYLVRVYFLVQHKDEKDRKVHLLYFDVSAQDIDI